jgi:threonine dehydratase
MQENISEWFVIFIGESTFAVIKNFVEDIILVSDEEIKR